MRDRPYSIHTRPSILLAALLATACASPAGVQGQTVAEPTGKETPRSLLEATTPRAAASQDDASADDADDAADSGHPGRLLIYSAITGHVPLRDKAYDPADRYRSPAEREAARARSLEAEIEEELERQERLSVEETGRAGAAAQAAPAPAPSAAGAEQVPFDAPPAPELRVLPDRLFDSEDVAIAPGTWQNRETIYTVRKSLDIDDDGSPEEVRYVDAASGEVIRVEQDLDFDGALDAWTSYEKGHVAIRALDSNGDGTPDVWERYADGRMDARAVDSDADGVRDTFYRYEDGQLASKSTDQNNDGSADKVESFANGHRVRSEEDRTHDGQMDTWTTFGVLDGREVVTRVERDTRGSGRPDLIEIYETVGKETRLARREEDVNGDGTIDVVSTYQDGKLVQRAISDEALSPL
jgi:hypothetical protein